MGIEVVELLRPVDAIGILNGWVSFIEIKVEGRTTYTREQLAFIAGTKFPVNIVRTSAELVQKMKGKQSLTQGQKDALSGFLALNKGAKWNGEKIDRILNS